MAWQGKVLRVDLAAGTCTPEPLNRDWAAAYVGQRGLATKYLCESMDPAVDALSPENVLIMATGPLTGTPVSTGGRYSVVTKGALTGAIACSNSGGYFGAEIKMAGWDMIIFHGRARAPVYLLVEDADAQLLPADGFLWGKSVWETEDLIRARHQDAQIRIASIGRAGELGVRFACVINDRDRAAGRSGVGAVMGSKNLKAVAVRGTGGVAVKDPARFMEAVAKAKVKIAAHPSSARLATVGTHAMMDVTNAFGSLPTLNSRAVQFDGVPLINVAATHAKRRSDGRANFLTNKACFACTIACGRLSRIDPGHFSVKDKPRYHGATGGLEYESVFALGPLLGVVDVEAATYVNALCNEHGMDPISLGGTFAAAMELAEAGAIGREESGFAIEFGSAEAMVAMGEATATGQGFGAQLGLGSKRLCDKYGRPEFAIVVKGQEFPGYDPRAMKGMGLAYATSNRGACHLRASPFTADFDSTGVDTKAEIVKTSQDRIAAVDSLGICAFSGQRLGARRHGGPVGPGDRGRLDRRQADADRRAHLEPGAPVQPEGRAERRRRHPARPPAQRTGAERRRRGGRGAPRCHAARILPAARMGRRWSAVARDPEAPGTWMKVSVSLIALGDVGGDGGGGGAARQLAVPDGATLADVLADVLAALDLPKAGSYATLLNGQSVPAAERAARPINDGDTITVFPPLEGG